MPLIIKVRIEDNKVLARNRVTTPEEEGTVTTTEDGLHYRYVLTAQNERFLRQALEASKQDGQKLKVYFDGTNFTVETDTRPVLTVTCPNRNINADGIDKANITVTRPDNHTGPVRAVLGGEYFLLDFANGSADITYSTLKSGKLIIRSTQDYKVSSPLTVHAYRV